MHVVSKFRMEYWFWNALLYGASAFLIGLCFYFSMENGKPDRLGGLFWIGSFGAVMYVLRLLNFIFGELKQMTISDQGIHIHYLVTQKKDLIRFQDITDVRSKRVRLEVGAGLSDGYSEMEIHLNNDRIITLSENQYANFRELAKKIFIYLEGIR